MNPVIRDIDEIELPAKETRGASNLWLVVFAFAAVAATITAAWQGRALGMSVFIFLIGVSVVCIFALLAIAFSRAGQTQIEDDAVLNKDILALGFGAISLPSLILQDGKPMIANAAYMALAHRLIDLVAPDTAPSVERLFNQSEKSASAAIFRLHHSNLENGSAEETIRTLTKDGDYLQLKVRVTPLDNGQIWQIEDVSGQVGMSHSLTEAPVGLFSVRPDGHVLEMNDVLRGWLGYDLNEVPKDMSGFIENPQSLLDSPKTPGRNVRSDARLITNKDVVSPTVMIGTWKEMESGDIYASVAVYGHSGLGSRSKAAVNDEEMAQHDFDVLGEAPFGVVHLDGDSLEDAKIVAANDAFLEMTGHETLFDISFKSLFKDGKSTQSFIEAGMEVEDGPADVRLSNGDHLSVNVYFTCHAGGGCTAYVIDIAKRKDLEDQLVQSHKMQAIGQLAGGVAHDFNNLLTVIRLNADELLGRHPVGDPSYPELQQINQTVARSAGLVRKLLAFSSKQTLRTEVLDVTETLSDLTVLLSQVMVERVKLDVVHGRGLPPIHADGTQLETILMNLCVNARDAMVEKGRGGTITLSSSLAKPEHLEKDGVKAAGDGFVIIEVADTGTGMDAETQQKIFEPFFTTKEQGKGTGLGLATVYGIVQQSGGHLRVQSKVGVGTKFRVYIPAARKDELVAVKPKLKPEAVKPNDLAGQGRILFVEDEDAVRAIAAKTLRKRGYTVIEACDGEEALEILEEGAEDFDLMISDVVMPGLDGPGLLKKGRKLLGDAEIVFISGYAEEEFSELLSEEPDVTFLPKPFTLKQLAEKVKTVISEPDPDADSDDNT